MAMATAFLILLLATPAVFAVDYTVGDNAGWSQSVDYSNWVSGKTFSTGDVLVFNYGGTHGVDEVRKNDYDSCATSNALQSYTGGNTRINLTQSGDMYFICPTIGHCASGMKLAVTVSGTPSSNSPSGSPPSSSTPPTTTSPPPPSGTGSNGAANTLYNMNNLMFVAASLVLGVMLA